MGMAKTKAFSDLSAEVWERPGAAEEIDGRKRAIIAAVRLNELRKQRGQTQAQLGDLLGMTQANVSRIERSDNLYLSTLVDYVGALGGHIEIHAVFDDDVVSLGHPVGPVQPNPPPEGVPLDETTPPIHCERDTKSV